MKQENHCETVPSKDINQCPVSSVKFCDAYSDVDCLNPIENAENIVHSVSDFGDSDTTSLTGSIEIDSDKSDKEKIDEVWRTKKRKQKSRSSDIKVSWKRRRKKKISRNGESNATRSKRKKRRSRSCKNMEAWQRRKKKKIFRSCEIKVIEKRQARETSTSSETEVAWKRKKRKRISETEKLRTKIEN